MYRSLNSGEGFVATSSNLCDAVRMKRISIDISGCQTVNDFYDVLLSALEAPSWHGRNLDALWDSITSDVNNIMPPYSIEVSGGESSPETVAALTHRVRALFDEACEVEKIAVEFNVG